jgi:hypothetical protein
MVISLLTTDRLHYKLQTRPLVREGKNTSTVIPASSKRRRKGNLVVSDETVMYGYESSATLTTDRLHYKLQTRSLVREGKNISTVIPASRKRRRKGNLVVLDETVMYGYESSATLTTDRLHYKLQTRPLVREGKNTSTVIPASRKRRRNGNLVVSDETVVYGYESFATLTTDRCTTNYRPVLSSERVRRIPP